MAAAMFDTIILAGMGNKQTINHINNTPLKNIINMRVITDNVLRILQQFLNDGNHYAALFLGYIHMYHYRYKNDEKGEQYYKQAYQQVDLPSRAVALHYHGKYYWNIKQSNAMETIWKMSSELEFVRSMYRLGNHYQEIHDYDNMKIYHIGASKKGHIKSMYHLGAYYTSVLEYEEAEKYYLEAVNKNIITNKNTTLAINNISNFYRNTDQLIKLAEFESTYAPDKFRKTFANIMLHQMSRYSTNDIEHITKLLNSEKLGKIYHGQEPVFLGLYKKMQKINEDQEEELEIYRCKEKEKDKEKDKEKESPESTNEPSHKKPKLN